MRIAICDKEKRVRNEIERHILTLYPGITVCQLSDSEELFKDRERYDIIYMDMQMAGENMSVMVKEFRKKWSHAIVIWMTEKEEQRFDSSDKQIQCLVKPFDHDKVKFFQVLRTAVEKVREESRKQNKDERTLVIKNGTESRHVSFSEILYLEISNRKIMLHLRDEIVEFYGKLGDYEKLLGEDFFRTHRTYLVHLKYVKKYNASGIIMENGEEVPLVKQKYSNFTDSYRKYTESQE